MMRLIPTLWCIFVALGIFVENAGNAAEFVVTNLDGVVCRPLDPGQKLASVLIFFGQDCPISNAYVPEINRICTSHTNFAFYIVQVDRDLTPAAARDHAREYDLHAPVLLDPEHRLARAAKAKVTPEAVVFGKNGKVLYRGRIDDTFADLGKKRRVTTQHDLSDALDAIAAGKKVERKETQAVGCMIE